MKFFLPLASDTNQAQRVHTRIANRLKSIGHTLNSHRVYTIGFTQNNVSVTETIGSTSENGEIVLAIFQSEVGYCICTYSRGAVWGEPLIALFKMTQSVEFFDEELL